MFLIFLPFFYMAELKWYRSVTTNGYVCSCGDVESLSRPFWKGRFLLWIRVARSTAWLLRMWGCG